MSEVTIYTKPNCPNCEKSKALMTELGIDFNSIDVMKDLTIVKQLRSEGFKEMPVIKSGDQKWSGHNESKIRRIVTVSDDDLWS